MSRSGIIIDTFIGIIICIIGFILFSTILQGEFGSLTADIGSMLRAIF